MPIVRSHRDLKVFQTAMAAAVRVYQLTERFPADERFAARAQPRRSAPSVCASIAEALRKRRYRAHFIAKLTDAEAEAAETQVWMELGWRVGYITEEEFRDIFDQYEKTLGQLVLFAKNTVPFGLKATMLGFIALTALFTVLFV